MMGWEEPLSVFGSVYGRGDGADSGGVREHVRLMIMDHPDAQPGGKGISVLNVGYGLGVVRLYFAILIGTRRFGARSTGYSALLSLHHIPNPAITRSSKLILKSSNICALMEYMIGPGCASSRADGKNGCWIPKSSRSLPRSRRN